MKDTVDNKQHGSSDEATPIFDRVCAFLENPETHNQTAPVEIITTHAARIFLAESAAYKIKLPVKYDYLDFSTLEKRRIICERELEVNKPYAPQIYRDVIAIHQSKSGSLSLDADGIPVEWAVLMNRFPEEDVLYRIALRGEFDSEISRDLGRNIARFHLALKPVDTEDGAQRILEIIEELERVFGSLDAFFNDQQRHTFFETLRFAFEGCRPDLDVRADAGMIRRCHGDLHLRNLVMIDGQPVLFDALEFDERLATTDVLYDLAFLLMDMAHDDLVGEANLVFNRYVLEAWPLLHNKGFNVLPLFLSIRSAIRAMVAAQTGLRNPEKFATLKKEAAEYFDLARMFLHPSEPVLIVVSGFSGSGKSTLAAKLAPQLGVAPGAVLIRSDLERKALLGVSEFETIPQDLYTAEKRREVYEELMLKAKTILEQGYSVVLDAVFSDIKIRSEVSEIAHSMNVPILGLWLSAPENILLDRVSTRGLDASDATTDVVKLQLENSEKPDFESEVSWQEIDASGSVEETLRRALKCLDHLPAS